MKWIPEMKALQYFRDKPDDPGPHTVTPDDPSRAFMQ